LSEIQQCQSKPVEYQQQANKLGKINYRQRLQLRAVVLYSEALPMILKILLITG